MSVAFVPRAAGAQRAGFVVVVGLHALVGVALLHGLARTAIDRWMPPPVVPIFKPEVKTADEPPATLPRPNQPALPYHALPVPDEPIIQPAQPATITTSREPNPEPGATAGNPGAAAEPGLPVPVPVAPRVASRPVIFNLQACAPTGDDYPASARRAEAAGTTRVRFSVSAAGALVGSEVVRSAGPTREHKQLDRIAQTRLADCSFGAGVDEHGRAAGGTFEVDYVWKLEN